MTEHVLSPLDQAHAHRLAGDTEVSLRHAIACSQASPDAPGPLALIARILVDEGRSMVGPEVAARLVDAHVRRGDLPAAVVAAQLSLDAGEDNAPLLAHIAAAFERGSSRLSAVSPAPPPFPKAAPMSPALAKLSGEALFAQGEALLTRYLGSEDPVAADAKLPTLPLFGALAKPALERLLKAIRVDEVSGDNEVVRQGDPGSEAFVVARGLLQAVRKQGPEETVLAQLGPGSIFGEMALLSAAPRNASVIAREPAQLLVLSRRELELAAAKAPELGAELSAFCHQRMQLNLARQARVLSGLGQPERLELLRSLESRFFEAGETLIARGQHAERILLLASGAVSVSIPEGSERLMLATLTVGDVVGEISMVLRRAASADVVAIHPTLAFEINQEQLARLMRKYPPLLVELYDLATRRDDEVRAASEDEVMLADDDVVLV